MPQPCLAMYGEKMSKLKKAVACASALLGAAFTALSAVAAVKRADSRYENEPAEKNPLEGKKVEFVPDESKSENADGQRGYLKAVGDCAANLSAYDKYVKRALDVVISFGGLVALSPVLAGVAIAIRIDDPGPVLFAQKRVGENKQYFKLHKFRSMKMSTPHDVPTHMLDNPDQYITKVGKFIRKHSLDELPQIWDIFIGNMSIIGPRPALWNQDVLIAERDKYGAKRLHIPIFHMEAGNRCKDECLPEETNRRIVDIISDVNMAYSEHARRYLADCGLPKERTYVTGSPMAEVLHNNLEKIEASDIHERLGLKKGKYILLSAHREENIDTEKNFLSLFNAINKMAEKYDMPILYSCHPRSKKRIESTGFKLDERVIRHEPLGFHDYNCLQMNAFAVVSDSGTLPEESSFFTSVGHPFPAICIRTSTERPEALDKACFILSGIDEKGLLQAVDTAVEMNKNGDYGIPVPDYIEENVSTKVVKIIQSYTGVVNKMVWRKEF